MFGGRRGDCKKRLDSPVIHVREKAGAAFTKRVCIEEAHFEHLGMCPSICNSRLAARREWNTTLKHREVRLVSFTDFLVIAVFIDYRNLKELREAACVFPRVHHEGRRGDDGRICIERTPASAWR